MFCIMPFFSCNFFYKIVSYILRGYRLYEPNCFACCTGYCFYYSDCWNLFCGINYFFRLAMEASRKCNADSKRFVQSAENRLAEFFFVFRALPCRRWNCSFIDVLAFKASFLGTFRRTDSACSRLNAFAFPQDFKVIFQF